jgi:beta-aspartyl-peptidase (threonine type)
MSVTQGGYAIVVHGGAGSSSDYNDGCELAVRRAVEESASAAMHWKPRSRP